MNLKYKSQLKLITLVSVLVFTLMALSITYVFDKISTILAYPFGFSKNYKYYKLENPIAIDDIGLMDYNDISLIYESLDHKDLTVYDPRMFFSNELETREYNIENMARYFSIDDYKLKKKSYISQANLDSFEIYGASERENEDGDEIMVLTPRSSLFDGNHEKIMNLTYEGKINNFVYIDADNIEKLSNLSSSLIENGAKKLKGALI
ncbi:MAG: hypothetical protein Q4D88_05385 [Anaerococcus sp.]|nr:hypothetical protein [Anaerococcus sp.]